MFSFSKIITVAAVAFGTLSQAVPLNPRGASIATRDSSPVQLEVVLTDVKAKLAFALEPINCLTHDNATAIIVGPILNDVNDILNDAVKTVDGLADVAVDLVLKGVDGVQLTVDDVFKLICDILDVVFAALKLVCDLVADISGLLNILPILVACICSLLQAIFKIVSVVLGNALVVKVQDYCGGGVIAYVLAYLHLSISL